MLAGIPVLETRWTIFLVKWFTQPIPLILPRSGKIDRALAPPSFLKPWQRPLSLSGKSGYVAVGLARTVWYWLNILSLRDYYGPRQFLERHLCDTSKEHSSMFTSSCISWIWMYLIHATLSNILSQEVAQGPLPWCYNVGASVLMLASCYNTTFLGAILAPDVEDLWNYSLFESREHPSCNLTF